MNNVSDEILQRLAALETALQHRSTSPASDPHLTDRPTPMDLQPYEGFYDILPEAQHDFFRSPLSEIERRRFLSDCPSNLDRQYKPPPLQTNNVGNFTKRQDEQLTSIQYRLSGITRPLDLMAHNLAHGIPPTHDDNVAFLRTIHSLLSDTASFITQLRIDNVCRDTGLTS